ncbi:hypothetical protein P3T36_002700 [Kitasatospora sp. MAP12-15]|uniref:hypothetical protein n=1 Tax=unclassified Kitasatospora TaxID=2633591 RepID=UPI0024753E97|nr:hypothetical protein [Kitasatospora sp. MAP12-44]MDH6113879.1 hypothetical protein [Kitasatospora sp. MAP12-44]
MTLTRTVLPAADRIVGVAPAARSRRYPGRPAPPGALDPATALWLNYSELYFSAMTRRVIRHGDFSSREDLIDKLTAYAINRNETARPYKWAYEGIPLKA